MFFKEWTADVSSGRLERFGENDMFFKEWRSCRTVYSMNGFYIMKILSKRDVEIEISSVLTKKTHPVFVKN